MAQAFGARISVAGGVRAPARDHGAEALNILARPPNHAAVLAPLKHKPSRARKTRVLDRDCARRQSLRMGRDEGTGSAGAEPRNCIDKEDDAPTAHQLH